MHLSQAELDYVSLAEVYNQHCLQTGSDPCGPLDFYRQSIAHNNNAETKLLVNHEINLTVPENMLSKFLSTNVPSYTHLFTLKKELITQLALTSFVGYIMGIGNRPPSNISFSKSTGNVLQSEFYPNYNQEGYIKCDETVPFRLTRNMVNAFTPVHIDGIFNGVMTAAALCFNQYKDQLKHHLMIFLRDDIIAWQSSDEIIDNETRDIQAENEAKKKLKVTVEENTKVILDRIKDLATPAINAHNLTAAGEKAVPTTPINKAITDLIEEAQSSQNVAQMDPTWMPWV